MLASSTFSSGSVRCLSLYPSMTRTLWLWMALSCLFLQSIRVGVEIRRSLMIVLYSYCASGCKRFHL